MFCTKCGKELQAGSKFCIYCGNVVTNKNIEKSVDNKNTKKGSKLIKIIIIILVGCLAVGTILVVKNKKNKVKNNENTTYESTSAYENNFDGTDVNDLQFPTSFDDAIVKFGIFNRDIAAERNAAETLDEFKDADKLDLALLVNGGNNWYATIGSSILKFGTNGLFKENENWGNGTYSVKDDFTLTIKNNSDRVASKGTLVLSCDSLGNKEIYQYILYKREKDKNLFRLILIDTVAHKVAYIYDSDLEGADFDFDDAPSWRYNTSFDYDLSNSKNINDTFYKQASNVVFCIDKFIQGEYTAESAVEEIEAIMEKDSGLDGKIENSIRIKINFLRDAFYGYINDPNSIINYSFMYKPINEIYVIRAELLNELGMQYFEFTRPYLD